MASATALGMVATYQRVPFHNDNAFIDFMGMDVRVRESDQFRNPHWRLYYLALRERGLSTTAAFIALGRRIARMCFVLLKKEVDFDPNLRSGGCMATKNLSFTQGSAHTLILVPRAK